MQNDIPVAKNDNSSEVKAHASVIKEITNI